MIETLLTVPQSQVWVRCPRCSSRATIRGNRVSCLACGYVHVSERVNSRTWCTDCHSWETSTLDVSFGSSVQACVKTVCPSCGKRSSYVSETKRGTSGFGSPLQQKCLCGSTPQVLEVGYRSQVDKCPDEPLDRLFALPYWLQTPCAGHVLWAANPEHLRYLSSFLTAQSRPRSGLGTVLPQWMISAKNRNAVLRALARLQKICDQTA